MIKATIISTLFVCVATLVSAQTVLSASGSEFSNSTGEISYTIGEPVIFTGESDDNTLTQGYHQTRLFVVAVEEIPSFEVSLYPNPTLDRVVFEAEGLGDDAQLNLLDANGQLVQSINYGAGSGQQEIQMKHLAAGIYFLNAEFSDDVRNVYRIVKQ